MCMIHSRRKAEIEILRNAKGSSETPKSDLQSSSIMWSGNSQTSLQRSECDIVTDPLLKYLATKIGAMVGLYA